MAARENTGSSRETAPTFTFYSSASEVAKSSENGGLTIHDVGLSGKQCNNVLTASSELSNQRSELLNIEAFHKCWNIVDSCADEIISKMNKVVFERICEYCNETVSRERHVPTLPTAVVAAGLNISDNKLSFRNLMSRIQKKCTPHIAVLHSHTCGTVELVVGRLVHQFTSDHCAPASTDEVPVIPTATRARPSRTERGKSTSSSSSTPHTPAYKKSNKIESMMQVASWYHDIQNSQEKRPLVVLIEDSESFDRLVLQQLIMILQTYREVHNLPIILVMGVTSASSGGVHGMLPVSLTSTMYIQSFQTKDTLSVLDELFQVLIIDGRLPLRLGPGTLQWLSFRFLSFDYSIQGFLTAIKYVLMNHFSTVPQAYLCHSLHQARNSEDLKVLCKSLSKRELLAIAQLPSVQTFFMHRSEPGKNELEKLSEPRGRHDTEQLRSLVLTWLLILERQILAWPVVFMCIHSAQHLLFGNRRAMSKRKLLVELYAKDHTKSAAVVKKICNFIAGAGMSTLINLMDTFQDVLTQVDERVSFETELRELGHLHALVAQDLAQKRSQRNATEEEATEPAEQPDPNIDQAHTGTESGTMFKRKAQTNLPKDFSKWSQNKRRKYQLSFENESNHTNQPKTKMEDWRIGLVKWFKKLLKNRFIWILTAVPLGESCYYDRTKVLKSAFAANPRHSLQRALETPSKYISCTCCNDDVPQGTMHDTMMSEMQRMVSFPTWFSKFQRLAKVGCEDNPPDDVEVTARFLQATTELQYLGYFKQATRRTENVIRTVF